MPLSRYLKTYPCHQHPELQLLYSTIKGSVVRVPKVLVTRAEEDDLSESERETLKRLEMYVEDPESELQRMESIVARTNQRSGRFRGTVVLNLDCNLDCVYCYEKDFRHGHYMSEATADLLVETVTRDHINQGRDVDLKFYGGEPLLSLPIMKLIAATLRERAASKDTTFAFGMVSNGTLLNKKVVEELLPLGLTYAQLTLDGPREVHDRQRPFCSGSGSFDVILGNIKEIYEQVSLKLGGNYDRDNYREYPRMLDALLSEGIHPDKLEPIMFAPTLPKSGRNTSVELAAHCSSSNEPWLHEAALYLREETLKRGFSVLKTVLGSCQVEFEHDLVVNYDGTLYKCPSFMGWPELSVGTLKDGAKDFTQSHKLGIWKNDTCLQCPYLPICFGGCRLLPLLEDGVIDRVDCRRDFYDANLEKFILQDLRYQTTPPTKLAAPAVKVQSPAI